MITILAFLFCAYRAHCKAVFPLSRFFPVKILQLQLRSRAYCIADNSYDTAGIKKLFDILINTGDT